MAKKKKDDDEPKSETSDGSIAANDAWTGLLAVSFLALAIGSGFLFYDWYQYESDSDKLPKASQFTTKPPGQPPVPPPVKADGGGDKKADGGDKKVDDKDKDNVKDKDKKDARLRLPSRDDLALATLPEAAFVSVRQEPPGLDAVVGRRFIS